MSPKDGTKYEWRKRITNKKMKVILESRWSQLWIEKEDNKEGDDGYSRWSKMQT